MLPTVRFNNETLAITEEESRFDIEMWTPVDAAGETASHSLCEFEGTSDVIQHGLDTPNQLEGPPRWSDTHSKDMHGEQDDGGFRAADDRGGF
jgi:hypothetical protein